MNWLTQKEGVINHYQPGLFQGTQPVRVVHHMLILMFNNTHAEFYKDLEQQIKEDKLNPQLDLTYEEKPIGMSDGRFRTPRVNHVSKKIEIHESFLSFLWALIYSIFVTYVETIDYPKLNKIDGEDNHPISQENIEKAKELFDYSRFLIALFEPWDKENLPNPEIYLAEERNYVEQTSAYYTEAVKFILCHEFTHLKMHVEKINKETTDSHFLEFEIEADNNAIDLVKKGISNSPDPLSEAQRLAIEIGTVFGVLAMFFFRQNTTGTKHPNAEDRLTNVLQRLELDDDHYAWGIACVGLEFWDKQFGLNFKWSAEVISYRDQYFDIVNQIKARI